MAVAAARRRADRDEDRVGVADGRLGEVGGEGEPLGSRTLLAATRSSRPGSKIGIRRLAQGGDLAGILVDAGNDVMAEIGETGPETRPT